MIYTVTFNPAIDYIVRMDKPLEPGMTNRSASEDCFFGGKGINVSTVLKNLGIENTALGFAAGFTGEAIVDSVNSKGIIADFIMLKEGISRINVKLKGEEETEINAQGPKISEEAFTNCRKAMSLSLPEVSRTRCLAMFTRSSLRDSTAKELCSWLTPQRICS